MPKSILQQSFGILVSLILLASFSPTSLVFAEDNNFRTCTPQESNNTQPNRGTVDAADCPKDKTICIITPAQSGFPDVVLCEEKKADTPPKIGNVPLCPGDPASYNASNPINSQNCASGTVSCYLPGAKPLYLCTKATKEIKNQTCDPTKDKNCTSATGITCNNGQGVKTALGGCINIDPQSIINTLLKLAVAAGGGIALLLMIRGSFQMLTSAGNADQLKEGRERFISAIIGLIFIVISVVLLQIIGVDILNLPGFGK